MGPAIRHSYHFRFCLPGVFLKVDELRTGRIPGERASKSISNVALCKMPNTVFGSTLSSHAVPRLYHSEYVSSQMDAAWVHDLQGFSI